MKSLFVCLFGLVVLAGCSSNSVKPQADATPKASDSQQAKANETNSANKPTSAENAAPADRSVYFKFDQSDLTDADKAILKTNAKYLKEHANAKVVLQGNTDERGSSEYNLSLGSRRAESAKKILAVLGVPKKNIDTVSFGKEKPKAECHEESCWSENRRADIVYSSVN
jgi:peptidoglycan-associated lipoprotein